MSDDRFYDRLYKLILFSVCFVSVLFILSSCATKTTPDKMERPEQPEQESPRSVIDDNRPMR